MVGFFNKQKMFSRQRCLSECLCDSDPLPMPSGVLHPSAPWLCLPFRGGHRSQPGERNNHCLWAVSAYHPVIQSQGGPGHPQRPLPKTPNVLWWLDVQTARPLLAVPGGPLGERGLLLINLRGLQLATPSSSAVDPPVSNPSFYPPVSSCSQHRP